MGIPSLWEDIEDRRNENQSNAQVARRALVDLRDNIRPFKSPEQLQREQEKLELIALRAELYDVRTKSKEFEAALKEARLSQIRAGTKLKALEEENDFLRRTANRLKGSVEWHKYIEQESIKPLQRK